MTHLLRGTAAGLRRAALLAMATGILAACSGGVSDPASNPTPTPLPLNVLPQTATLYSGLPTTFSISGGTAPYSLISSDQAAIPLSGSTTATSITVTPGAVSADTAATLTVRDATGTQVAAALTVKPRTVSNVVTVTPSASQAAVCGTSVCSGGDAEVRATLTQNGVPLASREVRFDVVSGDFRIVNSAPGFPETTALSATTRTDTTGTASVRIRVLTDATAQTGILQITDVSGGNTLRSSFTIYPVGSAPLTAAPTTVQFVGETTQSCAAGTAADVIVFGGRAPYLISQPPGFSINPTTLTGGGQRFTIASTGACSPEQPVAIVDANGATANVTVSNVAGPRTVTTPTFVAAPTAVTLNSCTDTANIALVGGSGAYFAASGTSALTASTSSNTGAIQRTPGTDSPVTSTAAPVVAPLSVAFSDGRTSVTVQVSIGPGASDCTP